MVELFVCLGAGLVLFVSALLMSHARRWRRRRRHELLVFNLTSSSLQDRNEASTWLAGELSPADREFAVSLLNPDNPRLGLDVAKGLLKQPGGLNDVAVQCLVAISCSGTPSERREALSLLRALGGTCPHVARAMMKRLKEEPNPALRMDIVAFLVEMAKGNPSPLEFALRSEIAKAVTGRLLDPVREVRFAVRISLQVGGGLRHLIKEVELTLMEILRSNEQDSVDAAAAIILENKGLLKAAVSCIPASKASPSLVRAIL